MAVNNETSIASISARLEELAAERDALTDRLERLERLASQPSSGANCKSLGASVTAASTAAEKITLFRRLFAGRSEVFSGAMGGGRAISVRRCPPTGTPFAGQFEGNVF
jgi:hypothetical protein